MTQPAGHKVPARDFHWPHVADGPDLARKCHGQPVRVAPHRAGSVLSLPGGILYLPLGAGEKIKCEAENQAQKGAGDGVK